MIPNVIVMLTHHDVTVASARDLFDRAADLPVKFWGFKDVGLPVGEMAGLVADLRSAGKIPVLEVVSPDETTLVEAASFAATHGIAYFTGGRFSEQVRQLVHDAGIQYFPFCGDVSGSPVELHGPASHVVDDARRILDLGADGIDLVAYRFTDGDAMDLAESVLTETGHERLIIAGSVSSSDRIRRVQELRPFGYTMGSALFDKSFEPHGSFRDNLARMIEIHDQIESQLGKAER